MPVAPGRCAAGRALPVRAPLDVLAGTRRSVLQPVPPAHQRGCRTGIAGSGGARAVALGWLARHSTLSAALILIAVLHICFFPFIWGNQSLLAGSRGVPSVMP